MSYYYNIEDDLKAYSDCWLFLIYGGRNCGKTYSTLRYVYENKKPFTFIKRTNEDVALLCAGSGRVGSKQSEYGLDLSPFKSINRDIGSNVKAFSIANGIGGFWDCNENGDCVGLPVGNLISLNSVNKVKGFDLSETDYLIFDEFVPQPWEKVNRKEGEMCLDLYKTVCRDREVRGREPLKFICLANAVSISSPLTNIIEVTDILAQMQVTGQQIYHDKERGILLHLILDNQDFLKQEESTQIYKALGNTAWGQMAFTNKFAYNDFSSIGNVNLKGYKPVCRFSYKNTNYYIYMKDGNYFMTTSAHNHGELYNLNLENDQKRFYIDYAIDFRNECIDGKFIFKSYTMYDLIANYHRIFKLR